MKINGKGTKKPKVKLQTPKQVSKPKPNRSATPQASVRVGAPVDNHYLTCLKNPFSPKALGARVPDMYSVPTQTVQVHKVFTILTDSSGTFTMIAVPNPLYCAFANRGAFVNGSTWYYPSGGTKADGAITVTSSNLSSKISNWRIVNYGLRLRNITAMTSNSGYVQAIALPVRSKAPTAFSVGFHNSTASADTLENVFLAYGLPYTGTGDSALVDTTNLSNFPDYVNMQGFKLSESTLDINPKICDPTAFSFKSSDDRAFGTDVGIGLATGSIYTGDATHADVGGFQTMVVAGVGLPASTACIEVELIYHLEGNPIVAVGAAAGVSNSAAETRVGHNAFLNALDTFGKMPIYSLVDGAVSMAGRLLL